MALKFRSLSGTGVANYAYDDGSVIDSGNFDWMDLGVPETFNIGSSLTASIPSDWGVY